MTNEEAIDLYPGDIIKAPPPVSGMVRFRVRERKAWNGRVQYTLQLYTKLGPGMGFGWHNSAHDHYLTPDQLAGYIIESRKKRQLSLF